jgi:outer membrane protein assembly factor BamB
MAPPATAAQIPSALRFLPWVVALAAALAVGWWIAGGVRHAPLGARVPAPPPKVDGPSSKSNLSGAFTQGPGKPSKLPGSWTGYRGAERSGTVAGGPPLTGAFPEAGPPAVWSIKIGFGYASPAVHEGRVYLLDYDFTAKADVVRCLSLDDGAEIWRRGYPVQAKINHGVSRTVPAVGGGCVVTLGPRCHVVCLDAVSGDFRWGIDLKREYGTVEPPWFAGQCPLIVDGKAILAPAGKDVLMMAVDLATGKPAWTTPNDLGWGMTHSSVQPATLAGRRQYVYCGSNGVVGVDAADGKVLWSTTAWKVSIANMPTPVACGEDRIFCAGGYKAGCAMLKVTMKDGAFAAEVLWRQPDSVFGSDQHTPVLWQGHLYGVIPNGQFACLDLDGKRLWTSGAANRFGIGPYLIADGLAWIMNDTGVLTAARVSPAGFERLGRAKVLPGHESWGPLTLVGTRLLVRDFDTLTCLNVGAAP